MTVRTAQWVFWVSLVLLLPLPFYLQHWAWLPCGSVLKFIVGCLLIESNESIAVSYLWLWLQLALGLILCWCLAKAYGVWSTHWPSTIRGSVMSLLVFSCLVIFSSIPVYGALWSHSDADNRLRTFLQIYE
ncbi:MAG TPA: hypothetical protein ENI05_14835 [Porticoccus sp.]|nr:hypothetical protein [Porticoccus sp.]